jgi:cytochrome c oxidase subunit 3
MFLGSQAWEWGHFIHGDKGAIQHTSGDVYHIAKQKPVLNSLCMVEGGVVEHTKADRSCCFELASIYTLMGVDGHDGTHHDFTVEEVEKFFRDNVEYGVRKPDKTYVDHEASLVYFEEDSLYAKNPGISPGIPFDKVLLGANLKNNEYGPPLFANCFFFITGFHGFHVFSGVLFLIIILINVIKGTYEKRGHYEIVEKVGLYWHFVDLVWVFVFTVFYLIISSKII